jgi:hypothetical protein
MYNIKKNDYINNPKNQKIYTPREVSQYLFDLLSEGFRAGDTILDPCSGNGSLLQPWKDSIRNFQTFGVDSDPDSNAEWETDFLALNKWERKYPHLVLCNPPFGGRKDRELNGEVWLDKIIELFGKEVPIVLFVPYNFRLPWTKESKRLQKFLNKEYPPIVSIISLPVKGLWDGVIFHSEILIFNIKNLKPHYFFS